MAKPNKASYFSPYAQLINKYIQDSGKTNQEIAYEVDMNEHTISRLRHGRIPPARREATEAIAKACGFDPEPLVLLGAAEKVEQPLHEKLAFISKNLLQTINNLREGLPNKLLDEKFEEEDETLRDKLNQIYDSGIFLASHFPVQYYGYNEAPDPWELISRLEVSEEPLETWKEKVNRESAEKGITKKEQEEIIKLREEEEEKALNRLSFLTGIPLSALRYIIKALKISMIDDKKEPQKVSTKQFLHNKNNF